MSICIYADHSSEGKLHLTYGDEWRSDIEDIYLAAEQSGLRINRDVNDGDPIGMGMGSVCIYQGQRLTSANAYLSKHPANLTIKTDTMVSKVLVNNGIANGVQTLDGCIYTATKEVILSGGALNTPQLLMLSGIGPSLELEKHSIPVVKVLPAVGKNLQDHCFSPIGTVLTRNETTPSVPQQCPTPMGWLKLPAAIASPEFDSLPEETKTHLLKPTVPMYEIATVSFPSYSQLSFNSLLSSSPLHHSAHTPSLRQPHAASRHRLHRRHLSRHEPSVYRHSDA